MLRSVRVLLPDGNELTLDEGASGRDAAAAIGPRLADAAVAVQVDGEVRDLRLPVNDGETIRILTDRDEAALAVLRHSTAHVMAQAVLHLWPDAKIAIGPAIADGFYYDFEFPEPISTDDLERIEERCAASSRAMSRSCGRTAWTRGAARALPGGGPAVQARARRGARRPGHQPLSERRLRGSVPRAAPADHQAHQGVQAALDGGRLLAGRLPRPMLTRIYGTAFFARPISTPTSLSRGGSPPRPSPAGARARPVPLRPALAGVAAVAPARHGDLERARGPAPRERRRGYVEVKTPLLYDVELWKTSGHWEKFRDDMFLVPGESEAQTTA